MNVTNVISHPLDEWRWDSIRDALALACFSRWFLPSGTSSIQTFDDIESIGEVTMLRTNRRRFFQTQTVFMI
jgi:hypothetical protein